LWDNSFDFLFISSEWMTFVSLRKPVWCFLMVKSGHPSSYWTHSCARSTWYDVYRQIIVGLLSVIDCLCFFFIFSPLTTKMHNCHFCLLFVRSNMCVVPKHVGSNMATLSLTWLLDLSISSQIWLSDPRLNQHTLSLTWFTRPTMLGSMPNSRVGSNKPHAWIWQPCQTQKPWVW